MHFRRFGTLATCLAMLAACSSSDPAGDESSSTSGDGTTEDPSATIGSTTTADTSEGTDTTVSPTTSVDTSDASTGTTTGDSSTTAPTNDPPEPSDDELFTRQDEALDLAAAGVLDNDVDADGDALTVVAFDPMSSGGGTVNVGDDGAVAYVPAPGFFGDDSFGYTVSDGSDEAVASVTVFVAPTSVQLAAVADGIGGFVIDGQSANDSAGSPSAVAGDFDGDGRGEVLMAAIERDAPTAGAGRTYVISGKADGDPVLLEDVAGGNGGLIVDGLALQSHSGTSLGRIGDFDGDGLEDFAIGAPGDLVDGFGQEGRAFVVLGRDDGAIEVSVDDLLDGIGGMAFEGEFSDDFAGWAVGGGGDVNADGFDDVLIGAPFRDRNNPSPLDVGFTYVAFGRAALDPAVDLGDVTQGIGGFAITGVAQADVAGFSAQIVGDVDGDGHDDILIGAAGADNDGALSGRAYVVFGKSGDTDEVLLSAIAAGNGGFAIDAEGPGDSIGSAVAAAGDFDGDGLADLLLGAMSADGGGASGRAYVVFGKADTAAVDLLDVVAGDGGFAFSGDPSGERMGESVSGAGDVNGDGLGDVIIGATGASPNGSFSGRAYVVYGRADGVAPTPDEVLQGIGGYVLQGEADSDLAGRTVSGGVDVDGDGLDDVVINAPGQDAVASNAGRSYVVFGVPTADP